MKDTNTVPGIINLFYVKTSTTRHQFVWIGIDSNWRRFVSSSVLCPIGMSCVSISAQPIAGGIVRARVCVCVFMLVWTPSCRTRKLFDFPRRWQIKPLSLGQQFNRFLHATEPHHRHHHRVKDTGRADKRQCDRAINQSITSADGWLVGWCGARVCRSAAKWQ